jgi:hypothetical protein
VGTWLCCQEEDSDDDSEDEDEDEEEARPLKRLAAGAAPTPARTTNATASITSCHAVAHRLNCAWGGSCCMEAAPSTAHIDPGLLAILFLKRPALYVCVLCLAGGVGAGRPLAVGVHDHGEDSDGDIDPLKDVPKSERQKRKDKLRRVRDKEAAIDARKRKKEGDFEVRLQRARAARAAQLARHRGVCFLSSVKMDLSYLGAFPKGRNWRVVVASRFPAAHVLCMLVASAWHVTGHWRRGC